MSTPTIPKIVHVSWNDKDLLNSNHDMVKLGIGKLCELNPEWDIQISDDSDVEEYLRRLLPEDEYKKIKDKHIVQKCDLWRLIKMLFEGGLYIDVDRLCNVKLDNLFMDHNPAGKSVIQWVLPMCEDHDFSHDFMMSIPGNPAYYHCISMYLHRMIKRPDDIYYLGAQTYLSAVSRVLLGVPNISLDPKKGMLQAIRSAMDNHQNVITYREVPPYDTITYQGPITKVDHEEMKRDFYAQSGLKHWTGEW